MKSLERVFRKKLNILDNVYFECEMPKGKVDDCLGEFSSIHHIVPDFQEGTNDVWNLVCTCKNCHTNSHSKYKKKRSRYKKYWYEAVISRVENTLKRAQIYCDNEDKSTGFMIEYMQSVANLDFDIVMYYLTEYKNGSDKIKKDKL